MIRPYITLFSWPPVGTSPCLLGFLYPLTIVSWGMTFFVFALILSWSKAFFFFALNSRYMRFADAICDL